MKNDPITSIDETQRRRFESDRLHGRSRPIEDYLPPKDDPRYLATLEELVLIDIEFSWKVQGGNGDTLGESGEEQLRVEEYLSRFPALCDPEIVSRLIHEECTWRLHAGASVTPEEYQSRFPDQKNVAERIAGLIEAAERKRRHGAESVHEIGRYDIVAEHGRGGFATVWRAHDPKLDRDVALKRLNRDLANRPDLRKRFIIEAQVAARLEHPGVVPVHDLEQLDEDDPYYTMKLVKGETLAQTISTFHAEGNRIDFRSVEFRRLLDVFIAVCRTMEYAHDEGVIHRDLKPQNIVVGEYGETIILDWGLAKVLAAEPANEPIRAPNDSGDVLATMAGEIKGTPAYMSPEQATGSVDNVDELSDIYSLGVILYQLLSGHLPFEGMRTAELLNQVANANPQALTSHNPDIPKSLQAICRVAMARKREDRFRNVADLRKDLERFLADEAVNAWREPLSHRVLRWMRRHRTATATTAVAAVLLAAASAAGYVLQQRAAQRDREHDAEILLAESETKRKDAEARRNRDLRLAELRTGLEIAEVAAMADIRDSRFAEAAERLRKAHAQIHNEPQLAQSAKALSARLKQIEQLATFYALSDRAQERAFFEQDDDALKQVHDALLALRAFDHADWWTHLPNDDLTPLQTDRLRWDVYRALMLFGALTAKRTGPTSIPGAIVWVFARGSLLPAERRKQYHTLLAISERVQRFRRSAGFETLDGYARYFLGEGTVKDITLDWNTRSPADRFYLGTVLYYAATFDNDPWVAGATRLGSAVGLPLKEKFADYRKYISQAAEEDSHHYWTQMIHAYSELSSKNYPGALDAFTRCTVLRPNFWKAYVERSELLRMWVNQMKQDDPKRERFLTMSRRDAERASELAPHEARAQWAIGGSYSYVVGHWSNSVDAFQRAMDLQGPPSLLGTERFPEPSRAALRGWRNLANRWRREQPLSPEFQVFWARAQWEIGLPADPEKAAPIIRQINRALQIALRRDPRNPYGYLVRAEVKRHAGKHEQALKDFHTAAKLDTKCFPAAWGIARSHLSLKQYNDALAEYQRLLTIAETNWQKSVSWIGQARALLAMDRPDDAAVALHNAIRFDPRSDVRELQAEAKQSPHLGFRRQLAEAKPVRLNTIHVDYLKAAPGTSAALLNGGFELAMTGRYWKDDSRSAEPPVWTVSRNCRSSAKVSTEIKFSGQRSLHIRNRSPAAKRVFGLTAQTIPVTPGGVYRISVQGRGRNLRADSVFLAAGDPRNREDWRQKPIRFPEGTYDWRPLSGTFRAGPTQQEIAVRIVAADIGEAWIDDVEIRLVKLPNAQTPRVSDQ